MTVFEFLIDVEDYTKTTEGALTHTVLATVPANEFWIVVPNMKSSEANGNGTSGQRGFGWSAGMIFLNSGEDLIVSNLNTSTGGAFHYYTVGPANGTIPAVTIGEDIFRTAVAPARGQAGLFTFNSGLTFRAYKFSTAL